jgi:hypothetical protein
VILFAVSGAVSSFVAAIAHTQLPSNEKVIILQAAINDSAFETKTGERLESYKYNDLHFERCSLKWTEKHEISERDQRTLAEFTETIVPLELIDANAIRADKLKDSGFIVSLITKDLRPEIVSRQRMQWGGDPATESTGAATGVAFYFRDREVAEKASKAITSLVRACQKK